MNLLGGVLATDASSTLYVFAIGADGGAWSAQQAAAGSSAWTGWTSSGQPAVPLIGPIAAATDGGGTLQIFATGQDGNIYHCVSGQTAWTAFGAPSGSSLGALGLVADPSGRLWLFGAGSDGNAYCNWESGGVGSWSGWSSLGAPPALLGAEGSFGAALDGDANPQLCAVGLDGNLYTITWSTSSSAWGDWASAGAPNSVGFVGPSSAAYSSSGGGSGPVWALGVGDDGNAWLASQSAPGGAWSAWACAGSAGGGFTGAGPLAALYSGQLYAAGAGTDGNVYLASCDGTGAWQAWQPLGSPLTPHLPMYTDCVAELGVAGTLDLGSSIAIALDGNSPFSIGTWFRLSGRHDSSVLLQKGDELAISLAGTTSISVELGGASSLQAPVSLQLGSWHYLLVTFTPSGNSDNSGSLAMYLDGGSIVTPQTLVGIAATTADYVVGGDLHGQLYNLSMWSACLAGPQLFPLWAPPANGPTLAASFWFGPGTAIDTSGNGNVVTLGGGASIRRTAPGLALDGASYAQPGALDPVNPGGGGEPFSITAWVRPEVPSLPPTSGRQKLAVLGNGTPRSESGLCCHLEYHHAHQNFVWTVQRGGALGTTVAASKRIPAGVWSHVAATYDGATLALYVDGEAVGAAVSGAIAANTRPSVMIGASPELATGNDLSSFFYGGIQALGVWTACLTAPEVAIAATTDPTSLLLPSCAAFYRFDLGATAQSTVSGVPVGLCQGAALRDFDVRAVKQPPPIARRPPRARPASARRAPSLLDLLEANPPAREARPSSALLSSAELDRVLAGYGEVLASVPEAQRAGLAELFEQNLYRGLRLQGAAAGPTPGMITHAQVGGDLVFYHHAASGPDEVARIAADLLSPCTAWIIDIVATAIGVLATAIGVGFSAAKVVKYLLGRLASAAVAAMLRTAAAEVTLELAPTDLAIRLARGVYSAGLLTSVVNEGISGYSWWNWVFAAIGLVLNIVALWVTGGWWLAFLLAQLAFVIAQLVWVVTHPPAGCKPGPHLELELP